MEKTISKRDLKWIFLGLMLIFISPSIVYILSGKKILNLNSSFTFFFTKPTTEFTFLKAISALLFICLFIGITICYYKILKNYKEVFTSKKEMIIFLVIVAIMFGVMLPLTSTDVFYYIGTGWSEAHYGVNPYYTSVNELMENSRRSGK